MKPLEGSANLKNMGDIIVNTGDTTRYNLNLYKFTATSLGSVPIREEDVPSVSYLHAQDSVLGYPCKKYRIIQRAYMSGEETTSYVWVAEDLKVKNLPLLAQMFGFRNTLFQDGSMGGITLKVELLVADGSVTHEMTAVEVVSMKLDSHLFVIPPDFISG